MHTFDRDLMNTNLTININGCPQNIAKSAAHDCFNEIETLETILSMYRFGSDISCINSSQVGSITVLSESTTNCISLALSASAMTNGAVDITMGEFFLKAKKDKVLGFPQDPQKGQFEFNPNKNLIKKVSRGILDLGSIGKGFAIDTIVEKLKEFWEIESAFLSFGASTIYAFGKNQNNEPWQVNLSDNVQINVDDFAVATSGTAVLGNHIIDGRTGNIPENQPFRTWAFCANSAIADSLSTAFMILSKDEIQHICSTENVSAAIQQTADSDIIFID